MNILLNDNNNAWASILESEGILNIISNYMMLDDISTKEKNILIYCDKEEGSNHSYLLEIMKFISKGNVLIAEHTILTIISRLHQIEYIKHNTNYHAKDFSTLSSSCNASNAKFYSARLDNGLVIGIINNLDGYWSCSKKAIKSISIDQEGMKTANETLSMVAKGNIRRYVMRCLLMAAQHLHEPLVSLWKFPEDYRSVFNLRIDVDPEKNSDEEMSMRHIDKTFEMAKPYNDQVSFFINLYRWVPNYRFFEKYKKYNFDIQSHNFFHCLYPSYAQNLLNFERAHSILSNNGINVKGFVAPEYFWYDHTSDLLEKHGYSYSNSFGFDYNNYPYKPLVAGKIRKYFEVPCCPLVYSKFKGSNGKIEISNIISYYTQLMDAKIKSLGEPCLKYEHPAILGRYPEIFKGIIEFSNFHKDVKNVTLTRWVEWLQKRNSLLKRISINYVGNGINNGSVVVTTQKSSGLGEFGVAIQYDEDKVYVKRLLPRTMQKIKIKTECKIYKSKMGYSLLGRTIYNPNEKVINAFRSRRHLKKLISNYMLFYKYKIVSRP